MPTPSKNNKLILSLAILLMTTGLLNLSATEFQTYPPAKTYSVGDTITYQGNEYECIQDINNYNGNPAALAQTDRYWKLEVNGQKSAKKQPIVKPTHKTTPVKPAHKKNISNKIIIPERGEYVIGTWTQTWETSAFCQPEDLKTYNHVSFGMITYLTGLTTGTASYGRYCVASPWEDKLGSVKAIKTTYPNPIYGYTIGGQGTTGSIPPSIATKSFDTGTPWDAFDIDAEGNADTMDILSTYSNVDNGNAKPILTTYTIEIDNSSLIQRVTYLENLKNPPDRYILMCYWGMQWNLNDPTWSNGGKDYPMIKSTWLPNLLTIKNNKTNKTINSKKIFLAMCTKAAPDNEQVTQFSDFVNLIKQEELGGLYIWRTSTSYPLTQATVNEINKLDLTTPLQARN